MRISPIGLNIIKMFESLRLDAYQGAADRDGLLTIGYGHTGPDVKSGMRITEDEAEQLLIQDLADAEAAVNKHINEAHTSQAQFDAMVSLAFNIGGGAFAKSTVLRAHNMRDPFTAAQAFSMWHKSAGKRRRGLIRRRQVESTRYCEDPWSSVE